MEAVLRSGTCAILGLDPHLPSFPEQAFRDAGVPRPRTLDEAGAFVLAINRRLIEAIRGVIPAVKLQSAFYEALGGPGMIALRESILMPGKMVSSRLSMPSALTSGARPRPTPMRSWGRPTSAGVRRCRSSMPMRSRSSPILEATV